LTEIPAAMDSSMAGRPSFVAGILTRRFGRSTISHTSFARVMVPSVSKGQLRGDLQRRIAILVLRLLVDGHEDVAGVRMSRTAIRRKISFESSVLSASSWSSWS
jgi:hypothetical protein